VGIECKAEDAEIIELVSAINDPDTWTRTMAERALNAGLHGSCQVPVAGYAVLDGDRLHLRGRVGEPDGSKLIRGEIEGPAADAEKLGASLAKELLSKGADKILTRLGSDTPA
jgi:hydroxymethylbilane synthase